MDKKAKKILFSTYWKNGWINAEDRAISTEDFQYAKSKRLMFDPFSIDHDNCVKEIEQLIAAISVKQIAQAFLSSLTSRRLDWRSAISSYVIAQKIPAHHYQAAISGTSYENGKPIGHSYTCGICRDAMYGIIGDQAYSNEDLNVLSFERLKWGGIRHGELLYTHFDLTQLLQSDVPAPTQEDIACFKEILATIASSEPEDYPSTLEKRLASVVKSNKSERATLIEILAGIGVLAPQSYDRPIRGKGDWVFAEYWRGEDKFSKQAVSAYFSSYL